MRVLDGIAGPAIHLSGAIVVDPPAVRIRVQKSGAPAVELDPGAGADIFTSIDRAVAAVRREIGAAGGAVPGVASLTTARPDAWRHYGLAEQELFEHRRMRALAHARAAAAIDPAFVRAQLMVAMITWADGYASRSEGREAIATLQKVGTLPASTRLLVSAAEATVAERGDGARRFREYLRRYPSDRFAHWLAVRMIQRPRIRERLELARLWIEDLPDDPEGYNQLGYLEMGENGDLVTAERYIRDGLRLAPLQVNLHDSLADVLHRQARISEALPVIRRALELDPDSVSALAKAAEYSLLSDELADAERYLETAQSRVDPEMRAFDRVVRVGGALHLVRGDVDGAVAYLSRWTHATSTGGRASIPGQLAAFSLALGGRSAESREELERARAVSDRYHAESIPMADGYLEALASWSDPARLDALAAAFARAGSDGREPQPAGADAVVLARSHLLRGNAALALVALKKATRPIFARQNSGASFMAQWLLAQALWKLGRLGEARAAFSEALRRRAAFGVHPESAFFWREFLEQGARLAEESGHEDEAALYRLGLARLDNRALTAGRSSRP